MAPMYRLADAISDTALLRRRLRRKQLAADEARRGRFIREYAPGRSFADIGGMYGIDGDVAFQAEAAGASRVTLFDSTEPSQRFLERRTAQGSAIRTVEGDLEDPISMQKVGEHDVVYCNGLIYHTPNPFLELTNLRAITGEYLLVGSATIPEIAGVPQACVYYPFLGTAERARGRGDGVTQRRNRGRHSFRSAPDVRSRKLLVGHHPIGVSRDGQERAVRHHRRVPSDRLTLGHGPARHARRRTSVAAAGRLLPAARRKAGRGTDLAVRRLLRDWA